jgi:hypothetical protein
MLREIKNHKAFCRDLSGAGLLLALAATDGPQAMAEKIVRIDGIGLVPARVVLACEQATGDGGQETFFDADWDYFSDCINDELYGRRKK